MIYGSFDLNEGEKGTRLGVASYFPQSVQNVCGGFPVSFSEVGLELQQSQNMFFTVDERGKKSTQMHYL